MTAFPCRSDVTKGISFKGCHEIAVLIYSIQYSEEGELWPSLLFHLWVWFFSPHMKRDKKCEIST